jgi:branched-chain amino acid transport system substrate-binding protein
LSLYFMREFKRLGGKIVSMTHIQTGDQDFSAQIAAIKAQHPDLIYAPNYYAEDALLAQQLKNLGVQIPILTGDGAQVPELITLGGPAVNGMYFTAHFHRDQAATPLARDFRKAYEDQHKKELGAFTALGADSYFLLLHAMSQTNSLDGTRIAQALAGTKDFPGVSGTITMGPDHNPLKGVVIIKVEKGKFVYQTTIKP